MKSLNQRGVINTTVIIGVIVGLVVLGGGGYLLTQRKSEPAKSENSTETTQKNNDVTPAAAFDPLSTNNLSFSATITASNNDGTTSTATMKYDKDTGNVSYSSSDNGETFEMVYTDDAYYMCQSGDSCIKYPLNGVGDNAFDRESYEFSDSEIENYRNTAIDGGEQDCPSGRCHVWKITEAGYESSIFIDTKTKRITQVEGKTATGSSKIVYAYTDVSVVPPANAQGVPSFNQ